MKNVVLFLFALISSSLIAQQVENGSFEKWEMENGKNEPVDWSSIQTGLPSAISGLAPKVVFEEANGRTGKCIKMENKTTFGIVANGIVTNGRVFADLDPTKAYIFTDTDDSRWNTPVTAKPDSIVGWFKYQPATGDIASVSAILHTGEAKAPTDDSTNYVALAKLEFSNTVNDWTRFSIPFTYLSTSDPEYVLIIITSGNGTQAVGGSVGYFDDIELIYNTVGVKEVDLAETINAYGGFQKITIDSRDLKQGGSIQVKVFDITGKERLNEILPAGEERDFNEFKSGVYILQMVYNNQVFTKKIAVR